MTQIRGDGCRVSVEAWGQVLEDKYSLHLQSVHPPHVVYLKVARDWKVADETFTVPLARRQEEGEGLGSIKWGTEGHSS